MSRINCVETEKSNCDAFLYEKITFVSIERYIKKKITHWKIMLKKMIWRPENWFYYFDLYSTQKNRNFWLWNINSNNLQYWQNVIALDFKCQIAWKFCSSAVKFEIMQQLYGLQQLRFVHHQYLCVYNKVYKIFNK